LIWRAKRVSDGCTSGGHDRLEREAIEFHHKVRQGYLTVAKQESERFEIIDATKALSAVQEDLRRILLERFSDRFSLESLV
jgi:dTMP kinase